MPDLNYYLNQIERARYAKDVRKAIVNAIRTAGTGGGSGGGSSSTVNFVNLGSEAKYIPYIYANMYDGILYELDNFDSEEYDTYRSTNELPCFIPKGSAFKLIVDINPNSSGLPYGTGHLMVTMNTTNTATDVTRECKLECTPSRSNLHFESTFNALEDVDYFKVEESDMVINAGPADARYAYLVRVELVDPDRLDSKVRYTLQEFIFNQSVTEPDDANPGRVDLTSYFNPRYDFVNGYKFSYSITVTPTISGYTPSNIEIATLYLYKEGTSSYQTITITDSASEQTGDITVTADYNKIRLEYPTGLDGGAILPYAPTISMQIYPYNDGGAPLVQEYDITQHESELTGMGFRKVVSMTTDSSLGSDFRDFDIENLYYCGFSADNQTVIDIYGSAQTEPISAMIYETPGPSGYLGIRHFINNKTNEHFIKVFSSATVSASWVKVDPEVDNINGKNIQNGTIPLEALNWDDSEFGFLDHVVERYAINTIADLDDLDTGYYGNVNKKQNLILYSNAASELGVPNGTSAIMECFESNYTTGSPTPEIIRQRTLTFPAHKDLKFIQHVTSWGNPYGAPFVGDPWIRSRGTTIDIPTKCIGFDLNGCVKESANPNGTEVYVNFMSGLSAFFASNKITSISSDFINFNPYLTDIYVDRYYYDGININLPEGSSIAVHYKDEFNLSDLLANSQAILNKRLDAENTKCIAFGSDGSIISNSINTAGNALQAFAGLNSEDVVSMFICKGSFTSIASNFYTSNPNLTTIYLNEFDGENEIDLNLPVGSTITVKRRGSFSLTDLLANSQAALEDRIYALENT